jgi:hypothetical protein
MISPVQLRCPMSSEQLAFKLVVYGLNGPKSNASEQPNTLSGTKKLIATIADKTKIKNILIIMASKTSDSIDLDIL